MIVMHKVHDVDFLMICLKLRKPGVVAHAWNPSTEEAKAGGVPWIQSLLELHVGSRPDWSTTWDPSSKKQKKSKAKETYEKMKVLGEMSSLGNEMFFKSRIIFSPLFKC